MVATDIIIYTVIVLMLLGFIYEQVLNFRLWFAKAREKSPRTEDITGYSCIDFALSGTRNDCDESIEMREKLEVGQILTCMIFPSRCNGEVSVNVKWFEIGVVSPEKTRVIYDRIFSGNYVSCFVCEKTVADDCNNSYRCRFVYRDSKGVYDFITDFTTLRSNDEDESEKTDLSEYLVLSVTGEMVYRFREDYVADKDGIYPLRIRQEAIEEDDFFFRRFVLDLLRGFIVNKQDKSEFMRECGKERVYGNNRILRKRITNYLRGTGLCIAD